MKALITGITGQDGGYLALYLLSLGYQVIGLVRRTSDDWPEGRLRLPELHRYIENGTLILAYGDVTDTNSLQSVFEKYQPDETYNLAAQSHVARSFEMPIETRSVNFFGALNVLNTLRTVNPTGRLYQASTSEMFGDAAVRFSPQDETTPFDPNSPYGRAKRDAHWAMQSARTSARSPFHTTCGILFNHESEVRGRNFVTRKITMAVANIFAGRQEILELGNIDAERDWGYAPDYVTAMHKMLQQAGEPAAWQDYVIATGENRTVRRFVEAAFSVLYSTDDMHWVGDDNADSCTLNTQFVVEGQVRVEINPEFFRPKDVTTLCGNPQKAIDELSWNPRRTPFEVMVQKMVEHDLKLLAS